MASNDPNSDLALASQPPHSNSEEDINYDIMFERAILNSLAELPSDPDTRQQITDSKARIEKLQKQLAVVRRAQPQHPGHPASLNTNNTTTTTTTKNTKNTKNSSSSSAMNGHYSPHLSRGGGPGSFSTASTPSNMSTPSTANSAWAALPMQSGGPSRKRSFGSSHLEATLPDQRENKSRRPSPSPADTAFTTPGSEFDLWDDSSIIDLTGDDDELTQLLRQEEERLAENKRRGDMDAEMARQLQGHDGWPPSSPLGATSGRPIPPGAQTFDRSYAQVTQMSTPSSAATASSSQLGRPGVKPEPTSYGATAQPGSFVPRYSIKPEPSSLTRRFKVPGAYDDGSGHGNDDDDDESPIVTASSSMPGLYGPYQMPTPGPYAYSSGSLNYAPGTPAIELARQAAISRQNGGQPSSSFGSYQNTALGPYSSGPWSMSQPSTSASTSYDPNRPGYLADGLTSAFHNLNSGYMLGSTGMANQPVGRTLADIIHQSNSYDFDRMTDGFGNPLDTKLVNYLADFVDDPRKTSEEIKELLSNIRPDMDIPEEERGQTPEALKYPLYTHQQLALKWMTGMEEGSNKGGILADDMGLGKTISTIALMITRKAPADEVKTNLIIGPVALIKQWENEIEQKVKRGYQLKVCLLHGKKKRYSELKQYDVVLTTYGTLAQEWKRFDQHVKDRRGAARYDARDDSELQRICPIVHPRSTFFRVILDEAQCIKNKDAQSSKGATLITATHRWCLTGTPMMNGVTELFSLIQFLRVRPYCVFREFQKAFSSLTAKVKRSDGYARDKAMQQLRIVLKAIMLRRMKNSEIDGKPILSLPPKTETSQSVVFSTDEQSFYNDLESKSRVIFSKYLRQGTIGKNYSNILVLLLRLRQACCHPHLNMDVEYAGNAEVSIDAMLELARTLAPTVVERIKAIEAFECPICYDAVEDPTLVIPCGHDTCSECFVSLTDNTEQNNIRSGQESRNSKCPQCRGPIVSTNVISYSAFKKVHMPEAVKETSTNLAELEDDSEESTDTSSDADSEDEDDDADDNGNLRDFIVSDDDAEDRVKDQDGDDDDSDDGDDEFPDIADLKPKQPSLEKTKRSKKTKRPKKDKGKGKAKLEEVKPHMLKTLRLEASKNKEARHRYMHYLKKNWQPSAKVTKITELLEEIQPSGEKTIIFSQWTSLLDLLEIPIKYDLKLKYCRYDGAMTRAQRDIAVRSFIDKPETTVMLVSLRAGNAGLNLTAASHIIICDPFWNPYIEMQAVDRAHRIGQQKPVKVHRVLVENTVEDRIVELQEKKRALVDAALDEGESKSLGRLSVQELRYLFGGQRD